MKYDSVLYTDRNRVLRHLTQLMRDVLLPRELQLVYLHCGIGTEQPMDFHGLARHLGFRTAEAAMLRYDEAVLKTRFAIPGSELADFITVRQVM